MKIPLDICNGFYESESLPLNSQRCVNLRPVAPQAQSLSSKALLGTDGIKTFSTSTDGLGRGSILAAAKPYFVSGTKFYSMNSFGVATNLGTVEGSGLVSMATNTTVDGVTKIVIVVPGVTAYVYNSSSNDITEVTDPDFQVSDTVVFKDGYFIFTASNGLKIFNSNLNDPLSYDALDTGTAEIDPDLIVGAIVNHNELFVMGEITGELFQNIGGSGFPFQRIAGANIQKGIVGKFAMVSFDNSFVFVGGGENELPAIWKVSGSSSVVKISNSAIDHAIQKYSKDELSNCFAMTYSKDGNFFATFTFESTNIASRTFVYNATTSALTGQNVWHENQSGLGSDGVEVDRWRVQSIVHAYGKLLVGDSKTSKIGYLDSSTYDEYGDTILRKLTTSPFRHLDQSQFWGDLELVMLNGVGLASGNGSDPHIAMSFSDDGGRTFSSEFSRSYGKIGQYDRRTIWRRQGRVPTNRVLQFRATAPTEFAIYGAHVWDELGDG